jgi:hypothetical protein
MNILSSQGIVTSFWKNLVNRKPGSMSRQRVGLAARANGAQGRSPARASSDTQRRTLSLPRKRA